MNRMRKTLSNIWDDFGAIIFWIGASVVAIVLLIAGFSFFATILLVGAMALAIVFGSASVLVQAFAFAVLLKSVSEALKPYTNIWFGGAAHEQFYAAVNGTGWITMFLMMFLVLYVVTWILTSLRSVLGAIRLVQTHNYVTVKGEDVEER